LEIVLLSLDAPVPLPAASLDKNPPNVEGGENIGPTIQAE